MRIKRKIVSMLLMFTVLVGFARPVCAGQVDLSEDALSKEYTIENGYIVDRQGHKYSEFCTASGEELSLEEALIILNGEDTYVENQNARAVVPVEDLVAISSLNRKYVGAAVKVSPDCKGPGTLSYTLSRSVSYSISGSFSVAAQEVILRTIEMEFGISLTTETTSTVEVSVDYPVSSGKTGAVYFKPYYVRATGTYTDGYTKQSFTSYYPKLLNNGFADGLFYLYEY